MDTHHTHGPEVVPTPTLTTHTRRYQKMIVSIWMIMMTIMMTIMMMIQRPMLSFAFLHPSTVTRTTLLRRTGQTFIIRPSSDFDGTTITTTSLKDQQQQQQQQQRFFTIMKLSPLSSSSSRLFLSAKAWPILPVVHPERHQQQQQRRTTTTTQQFNNLDDFLDGMDDVIEELMLQKEQDRAKEEGNNIRIRVSNKHDNNNNNNIEKGDATRNVITGGDGWRVLQDDNDGDPTTRDGPSSSSSSSAPSPVQTFVIRGRTVHVKRDDMLKLDGSLISGNKARKMWTLNRLSARTFPKCVVSYGGPQSNSMVALAAIVHYKNRQLLASSFGTTDHDDEDDDNNNKSNNNDDDDNNNDGSYLIKSQHQRQQDRPIRFVYYTKRLPRFLRNQPSGNLYRAQSLGMELVEVTHDEYNALFENHGKNLHYGQGGGGGGGLMDGNPSGQNNSIAPVGLVPPIHGDSLWVPQGGAFHSARVGSYRLAKEIVEYWQQHGQGRPLTVCIPGGTCTTAVLVHHGLQALLLEEEGRREGQIQGGGDVLDIEVVVIPCVGDAVYARRQMMALSVRIGADPQDIPTILQPGPDDDVMSTTTTTSTTMIPTMARYFTFAQPDKEILQTFEELRERWNLVVDLIYGAPAFAILFRHWEKDGDGTTARMDDDVVGQDYRQKNNMKNDDDSAAKAEKSLLSPDLFFDPNQPIAGREIMYVHSGGLEGINSQLLRYQYHGLVEIQDVQLPGKNR